MSARTTRSGRTVKSVVRYEPDEENLVDDFSDDGYDDSDFGGTMDGLSEGSHVLNTDEGDESYTGNSSESEASAGDDGGDDSDDDSDSVITEYIPNDEILSIADTDENDGGSERDSDDSEDTADDSDSEESDDSDEAESSSDESGYGSRSSARRQRRKKPREA